MVNEDIKRAADYAAQIVWRLETLQYRSRFNEQTGETTRLPTKIRRFANGLPRDLALPVLHVIANGSPYTGKNLFNGEGSDDEFVSTGVYIRKDQTLDAGSRKDATYTIVQDLRLRNSTDELSVGDSVSCSRESYSDYRWDEVTAELPPDAAPEQGVVWQVTDVRREADTELFSYHIRKSVAVTQHTEPVVTQCDKRHTVTTEIWDNVYGGPDTGYEYDSVRNGGVPIEIPECSENAGETVSVRVSQNEDCTYQIIIERAISKQGFESEYLRYKDKFRTETSDTVDGQSEGLNKSGVEVSGGVMTRYESHQNDDGTWRNRVTKISERDVQDSDKQVIITPRYTSIKWTDTSVSSKAAKSALGGLYGSYRFTKTPGGRFTNEYVTYEPSVGDTARTGEVTLFARMFSTEDIVTDFEDTVFDAIEFVAGGGKTYQKSYTKDETTGLVTRRVATRTELQVEKAVETVTNTLIGSTLEVTHRNLKDGLPAAPIVGSLTYRKTDGGFTDVEKREFVPPMSDVVLVQAQARTVYETRDSVESVLGQGSVPSTQVESASGGKFSEVTVNRDPQTGVYRTSTRTTQEQYVPVSSVTVVKNLRNSVIKTVKSNSIDEGMGAPGLTELSIGTTIEKTLNPGGSVTLTTTTKTPNTNVGVLRQLCSYTATEHTDMTEEVDSIGSIAKGNHLNQSSSGASNGIYQQVEYSRDDDNVVTKRETVTQEINQQFTKILRNNHLESAEQRESTSVREVDSLGTLETGTTKAVTASLTRGGNYDVVNETVTAKPTWWEDRIGYADSTDGQATKGLGDYCYKIGFRNCDEKTVGQLKDQVYRRMSDIGVRTRFPNRTPFINRMVNEFGLFDGSVGFNAREERYYNGGGSGGDSGDSSVSADYTKTTYQVIPNSAAGYFDDADSAQFVLVTRKTKCHIRSGRGSEAAMRKAFNELSGAKVVGEVHCSTGADYSYSLSWETADSVEVSLVTGKDLPIE